MTSTPVSAAARRFYPLEQADFLKLEQAASLKGLLQPFKGKGALTQWASQCHRLRDELIELAQRRVLAQANAYPYRLLPVELAQQTTGAGTTFLRWRKPDRSAMGVALWQALIASATTPSSNSTTSNTPPAEGRMLAAMPTASAHNASMASKGPTARTSRPSTASMSASNRVTSSPTR